jgi:phosphoenolpyruvate carboxykinase (ATP)
MIKAALTGALTHVDYITHPVFGLQIPKTCPDVPNAILNPRDTWRNEDDYDHAATELANRFIRNFEKYADKAAKNVLEAGPKKEALVA